MAPIRLLHNTSEMNHLQLKRMDARFRFYVNRYVLLALPYVSDVFYTPINKMNNCTDGKNINFSKPPSRRVINIAVLSSLLTRNKDTVSITVN